ncbi:MAG: hypothetical protein IIW86_00485 [Clostridia bacterium]|nr:hypothetical protein [Clostridia bacterium]
MELINAREAAKIASAARAEIALMRTSLAECCVKEDIMPCIAEEADYGRNVVVVEVALNSDAYKVRDLIISILTELGYNVRLGENSKEFIIKW